MLTKRIKDKQNKKISQEDLIPPDNIQSLRSWIRKLEQTINSVSARLTAVEKRLSRGAMETNEAVLVTGLNGTPYPINKVKIQRRTQKQFDHFIRYVDTEITALQEQLMHQKKNNSLVEESFHRIYDTVETIKKDLDHLHGSTSSQFHDIQGRLMVVEQKEPLMMRLGTLEIPIEFTGLIGGILIFFIAALVILNRKEIVLSPIFLGLVGIILIGSAFLKIMRNRAARINRTHHAYSFPIETEDSSSEPASSQFKG